jgi:SAM-dependent methyltransferase
MAPPEPFHSIVAHYEDCLRTHGAGAQAVNWKSAEDAALRYDVMLGLVQDPAQPAALLDFGCGLAALKMHMQARGFEALDYTGLEISPEFAAAARAAHPEAKIICLDVLADASALGSFDYIVMNGIFTRRHDLSIEQMDAYMRRLLPVLFERCRIGLAFNVMSKAVDWENDELFHPEPGALLAFIGHALSRHYVLRNDYGLHETTLYVYRQPVTRSAAYGREDA